MRCRRSFGACIDPTRDRWRPPEERGSSDARDAVVRRILVATLAAAALLWGASAAQAAPFVDVTYDLSDSSADSTIPLLNVTTSVPPHGFITGTQTIRYASDSAGNLVPGPVDLISFNLYVHATVGDYGYTPGGGIDFITLNTADLHIELLGIATGPTIGQLLAGGTVTPLGASGLFEVTGTVHCVRLCAVFNMTASQTTGLNPKQFTAPLPVLTGAVGQPHTVRGTAYSVNFKVQPIPAGINVDVTGTTFIVGREIARTSVPEPATLTLFASGLTALAFAGAAARGWARRS